MKTKHVLEYEGETYEFESLFDHDDEEFALEDFLGNLDKHGFCSTEWLDGIDGETVLLNGKPFKIIGVDYVPLVTVMKIETEESEQTMSEKKPTCLELYNGRRCPRPAKWVSCFDKPLYGIHRNQMDLEVEKYSMPGKCRPIDDEKGNPR